METIDSVNLVPGDVIIIKFGDIVPADIKILPENDDEGSTPEDETPMSVSARWLHLLLRLPNLLLLIPSGLSHLSPHPLTRLPG